MKYIVNMYNLHVLYAKNYILLNIFTANSPENTTDINTWLIIQGLLNLALA